MSADHDGNALADMAGGDLRRAPRLVAEGARRQRGPARPARANGAPVVIAALFVETGGAYFGLPDVDPWDESRDARLYAGPHPVVAHPPCARWSHLAGLVQARYPHLRKGDDGGCFASALASVRLWGGVLEHPAHSKAWAAHDLLPPPAFGWARDMAGGWVCEVSQTPYGHRARKLTWLYYVGPLPPPPLNWTRPPHTARLSWCENHSKAKVEIMGRRERNATPPAFRDLLLSLARSCCAEVAA